jgi:bifunctional UDP-N-acetylglucosamine pyrophosphorylase/glucosamine-1-phosphate N-acetyltransferase
VLVPKSETLGINKIKDLIELDQIFQSLLKEKLINSGVIIQNPDSVRVSFDTKIKKGSIIESFVQINPSVKIFDNVFIKSHTVLEGCIVGENSIIGPSARIRPKTKIGKSVKIGNYVEIKNSEIGNNCSISHLSYIGDSKLGNNVNIGAGTITCNYDGKKKNITVIKNNVFVGSNSSLVAPITIGKNSTIGAGSVITRNIPSNHLAVERSNIRVLRKPVKK